MLLVDLSSFFFVLPPEEVEMPEVTYICGLKINILVLSFVCVLYVIAAVVFVSRCRGETGEVVTKATHFKIADGFLNRSKLFYAKGPAHVSRR